MYVMSSIIFQFYYILATNTSLLSLLSARKYVAVGIRWRDRLINHEPTPSIPPSVGAKTNGCLATSRGGGAHRPASASLSLTHDTYDSHTHTHARTMHKLHPIFERVRDPVGLAVSTINMMEFAMSRKILGLCCVVGTLHYCVPTRNGYQF